MIDLHIHSNYSDGSYSVIDILKKAEKNKLEYISITDHDCVNAYKELKNINITSYYKGKIIIGCEFKCFLNKFNIPIEVLGYNLNIEKLKKYFQNNNIMKIQSKYLEIIKTKAKKIGLIFNENLKLPDSHCYASAIFQDELLRYPENKEIMKNNNISLEPNFYRAEQCNKKSLFYIDENVDLINITDILKIIHEANGLVFLAHPYIYPVENVEKLVEYIVKVYNIDGIECYYSTHTDEQTQKMLYYAKKYNVFISGGTDFHGKRKPNINIGTGKGNLKINKSVILNWVDNCPKDTSPMAK